MYPQITQKVAVVSRRLIVCVALLGGAGANGEEVSPVLATLSGSQDIRWEMNTSENYSAVVLRVVGPDGFLFEARFADEARLDGPLADGQYKYELYLVPTTMATTGSTKGPAGVVDANGRPIGSVRAPVGAFTKRGTVQSGSFAIRYGLLVDPNIEEG